MAEHGGNEVFIEKYWIAGSAPGWAVRSDPQLRESGGLASSPRVTLAVRGLLAHIKYVSLPAPPSQLTSDQLCFSKQRVVTIDICRIC